MKLTYSKLFYLIMAGGVVFRLLFILVLGKYYFGRDNFFFDHDTGTWAIAIYNLMEHGEFTSDLSREMGYFMRMPGYSFFMYPFYLITGHDWWAAIKVIGWFQTILDIFNVWFVYKLGRKLSPGNERIALIFSALYAFYPFIVVWNPVCYSELMAISIMLYSLWFIAGKPGLKEMFFSGLIMGLSVLFRPQISLLIPAAIISFVIFNYGILNVKKYLLPLSIFTLGVCCSYGLWPARNYINHGKLIFSQNLTGINQWNSDVMEFRQFIYSIKAEWEPQFTQIISNKPVTYPAIGLLNPRDSLDLIRAFALSKECGYGFSYWSGYWKKNVSATEDCSSEIAGIYKRLRLKQATENPWNYYIKVPLQNIKKALFKFSLNDSASTARKFASLLFVFRTLLIFFGLAGFFLMLKESKLEVKTIAGMCLLYFLALYIYLCFGTGDQCRNIEMRYFLPADVLLLIPAAWLFDRIACLKERKKLPHSN